MNITHHQAIMQPSIGAVRMHHISTDLYIRERHAVHGITGHSFQELAKSICHLQITMATLHSTARAWGWHHLYGEVLCIHSFIHGAKQGWPCYGQSLQPAKKDQKIQYTGRSEGPTKGSLICAACLACLGACAWEGVLQAVYCVKVTSVMSIMYCGQQWKILHMPHGFTVVLDDPGWRGEAMVWVAHLPQPQPHLQEGMLLSVTAIVHSPRTQR